MGHGFFNLIVSSLLLCGFSFGGGFAFAREVKPWKDSLRCECLTEGNAFSIRCQAEDQSFAVTYPVGCRDLSVIHEAGRFQDCSSKNSRKIYASSPKEKEAAQRTLQQLDFTKWRVRAINANGYKITPLMYQGGTGNGMSSSPISCYARTRYYNRSGDELQPGSSVRDQGKETNWYKRPGSLRGVR